MGGSEEGGGAFFMIAPLVFAIFFGCILFLASIVGVVFWVSFKPSRKELEEMRAKRRVSDQGTAGELFMVMESFETGGLDAVSERFHTQGRLLPDGVAYLDSWMTPDGGRCFQLMRASDRASLDVWISRWSDIVDFEVFPIESSAEFWARQGRI